MAEQYSTERKEKTTISLDKNLYEDLNNYAKVKGLNKSETLNEILFNYFKNKTLTNTYLTNKAGLQFKIPMDIDIKKRFINNKTILNNTNSNIGENTGLITISRIPNNLDVFSNSNDNTSGSFTANKEGVLHAGIDFVFIPSVIKKPKSIYYSSLDIDLLDGLYVFYFEVTADNTTNVVLINPVEAINKLSTANNRKLANKLSEWVQILEDEQKQINYVYKSTMEHLYNDNNSINQKDYEDILNNCFLRLEMDLLKNERIQASTFKNENCRIN